MKVSLTKLALWIIKHCSNEETRIMVLNEAVKHLFYTVSLDDILKVNPDGTIQFEGKTMDSSYRKELREQANLLENLLLWKVINKDITYQLQKKMFNEAVINNDVVWGKLLTFLWDIIKQRISQLKK